MNRFPNLNYIFSPNEYRIACECTRKENKVEFGLLTFLSNVIFTFTASSAHNFFHQKLETDIRSILSQSKVSASHIIVSLLYIKNLSNETNFEVKDPFKVFLVALLLADAYLNDVPFEFKFWVELSNIPRYELVSMKSSFLKILNFNLYVGKDEYFFWLTYLDSEVKRMRSILKIRFQYIPKPITHNKGFGLSRFLTKVKTSAYN
ncbi:hypothetical protein HDU92_000008 [Lobulomyces angularis]|nr:hypothetical protein HDU92_000008 [Lobulomyces angularis]